MTRVRWKKLYRKLKLRILKIIQILLLFQHHYGFPGLICSDLLSDIMIKYIDIPCWLISVHFCGTGHCFPCPFLQRESHQDLLSQPSLVLHCLPARSSGNQILFGLKLSIFKLFQMMKCQIFSVVIPLLLLASKLVLQMARGSPLLTVTWDHLPAAEVAGSWYYNLFLRFLLSPPTLN